MVKQNIIIALSFVLLAQSQDNCNCSGKSKNEKQLINNDDFSKYMDIRTDGYYYRIDENSGNIEILIFLRNRKILQGYFKSENSISEYLSNERIILTSKHAMGTFGADNKNIIIKYPVPLDGNELGAKWGIFKEEGKIINENTILFFKGSIGSKIISFNHYYKFRNANIPKIIIEK